jgi:hypothetical protein
MKWSQAAIDLIWREETGGDAYYDHTSECRADWPGVSSGVTIGGFYDLGYVTREEFHSDWDGKLPPAMTRALDGAIGIHGRPARALAHELARTVSVPDGAAREVFLTREIPKWEAVVTRLPNADKLSGNCFGVLVSLAMNRGDDFAAKGSRFREMRAIRADLAALDLTAIPAQIRAMKRLWPKGSGLQKRRDDEAALFAEGLKSMEANT